jgi:hypothetical protein
MRRAVRAVPEEDPTAGIVMIIFHEFAEKQYDPIF